MNSIVDKVFVINIDSAKDRLENITKQLNDLNIEFERITPIDSSLFEGKVDMSFLDFVPEKDRHLYTGWNKNSKSLQETTKLILKNCIKNNYKRVLILEDDSIFVKENYTRGLESITNFIDRNKHWDFIHMNYLNVSRFGFSNTNGILRLSRGAFCCQGYIINNDVYEHYLKLLEKFEIPIDHITKKIHITRGRSFGTSPKMVIHKEGEYSTIREKKVGY